MCVSLPSINAHVFVKIMVELDIIHIHSHRTHPSRYVYLIFTTQNLQSFLVFQLNKKMLLE